METLQDLVSAVRSAEHAAHIPDARFLLDPSQHSVNVRTHSGRHGVQGLRPV